MILSDRYLMLIAVLTVLLNVVNTSGEYLFGRYVVDTAKAMYGDGAASQAAREQFIGTTYSSYFSYVNLIGFLLQMFVVSRVFKFLGVGKALFIHPIVALSGYLMMLRAPSFEAMRWLKIADNSLDYSLGQHDQAGVVAADEPRGEIQGQAGGRLLLHARRRRRAGRRRLRG